MRDLAEEQTLEGYEYTDLEFFQNLIYKYKTLLIIGLSALSALIMLYIFYKKRKGENLTLAGFFQTLVLLALFFVNNQFFVQDKAIIQDENALLMSGPSAGAEPIEVVSSGHRVKIIEEEEAWIKIEWRDGVAYIRKNRLLFI